MLDYTTKCSRGFGAACHILRLAGVLCIPMTGGGIAHASEAQLLSRPTKFEMNGCMQ